MAAKTIKLTNPIVLFEKQITEIALKEPKGGLYAQLGDPRLPVTNPSAGTIYFVENQEVISKYLDALIDHEQGHALISLLSLQDAMEVKNRLLGFFMDAEVQIARKFATVSASA